jgi:hypothetical protein
MADKTGICNLALQKLGLDPIVSIDDREKSARAMKTAYDMMRQNELRAHNWKFAEQDANLAALSDAPLFDWNLQYQLPADYLKLRQIAGIRQSLGGIDYRSGLEKLYTIKGRRIYTNLTAPLPIIYTGDITDTTLFDANFNEMFACRLSKQTCRYLTQNDNAIADINRDYRYARNQAVLSGALELPPEGMADDSFVTSRL